MNRLCNGFAPRSHPARRAGLPLRALLVALAAWLLCAPTAAADSRASGEFRSGDATITVRDVYAYLDDDPFDDGRKVVVVVLAGFELDKAALDAASDRENALTRQQFDNEQGLIRLTLGDDGKVRFLYAFVPPGSNINISGVGESEVAAYSAERVAGRFLRTRDADDDDDVGEWDLSYAVDVAAPGPAEKLLTEGTPLPAGGGAPGAAYSEHVAAIVAGDIETVARAMPPEQAAMMLAARNEPAFAKQFEFLQHFSPAEVTVTGGHIAGGFAVLDITGKDTDGNTLTGQIEMRKIEDLWRVTGEHLTTVIE